VTVSDITPEIRAQLQLPSDLQGALITNVDPESASAEAGLQEGDIVLSLNRQPVNNANEAVRLSDEIKGPKVIVRLWRKGVSRFVLVDESEK
jgi:serine protease Do